MSTENTQVSFRYCDSKNKLEEAIKDTSVKFGDIVFVNDAVEGAFLWTRGQYVSITSEQFKAILDLYTADDIVIGSYVSNDEKERINGTHSINQAVTVLDNRVVTIEDYLHSSEIHPTETTLTLQPNTFYVWDVVSALTLSLEPSESGKYGEYLFQFSCGDTATTLSLPSSIKWAGSNTILPNKTYQISIINNIAVRIFVND